MMILISGQPGNGKTLRALREAEQEHTRCVEAAKKSGAPMRRFFSNIAGSTYPDNPDAFPWMEKLPEHNDWRELPDGSYVIYDEAHSDGNTAGLERYGLLFPSTGKPGESDDPRIRAMSTHRHRGFDLVFVTQWPNKIHHNVRSLVGRHVHMNRAMGLQAAGTLGWSRVQPDPYDEKQREKAEEEIWHYPKTLYKRYRSATLHTSTYKFKLPKKLIGALSTAAMIAAVMAGLWAFVFDPNKDKPETEVAALEASIGQAPAGAAGTPTPQVQLTSFTTTNPDEPPPSSSTDRGIRGCISSPRGCRCWDWNGVLIRQDNMQCEAMAEGGLITNLGVGGGHHAPGPGVGVATPTVTPSPSGTVIPGQQVAAYGAMSVPVASTSANPAPATMGEVELSR